VSRVSLVDKLHRIKVLGALVLRSDQDHRQGRSALARLCTHRLVRVSLCGNRHSVLGKSFPEA